MYEQTLKYIAETLLKSGVDVSSPGLLHGKTGLVIFFFHYARYTGNHSFEDHAMALMERIQEQIQQQHVIDYTDGIAGIGTAIEYLAQNNFVDADTNEILEEFDKQIFLETVYRNRKDVSLFTGLSGLGRYFLFRVMGRYVDDNRTGTLNNKMSLIHILDTFYRMYTSFNRKEIEEALGFLYTMNQTDIYPTKVKRLMELLTAGSLSSDQDDITRQHQRKITEFYSSKYGELLTICRQRHCEGDSLKQSISDTVPGLYGGLAGIGLYLLSQLDKQHETWMNLL